MNTKRTLLALLIALALPATAQAFNLGNINLNQAADVLKSAGEANKEMTEKDEIALGGQMASTLLGTAPLVKNPALQKYVNDVGRWLALQSDRPDLNWHFGVIDDEGFNAFATPGGYILITKGLLKKLDNEAELAGVLAHEIAHVTQKHYLKAIKNSNTFGAITGLAAVAIQSKGDQKSQVLGNIVKGSKELYARGLDKSDEYEADRMGMVIAARAGYTPFGLPEVLHILEKENPGDPGVALLFKTHPVPEDRLKSLDQAAGDKLDAYGGNPTLESRYRKYKPNGK